MNAIPAERLEQLKTAHGDGLRVYDVAGYTFAFRRPTRDEYGTFINDGYAGRIEDGQANLVVSCAVWPPTPAEVQAAIDDYPALADSLSTEIDTQLASGGVPLLGPWPLERLTAEQSAKLQLDPEKLKALRQKYPRDGQLAAFSTPGGAVVCRRPKRSSYNDVCRRIREGRDPAGAYLNLCADCIVWPEASADANPLLDIANRFPSVPVLLGMQLKTLAGEDLKLEKKTI